MNADDLGLVIFRLHGSGCDGSGRVVDDGFLVLAGAIGRAEESPSLSAGAYKPRRDALISGGELVVEGEQTRLIDDHVFSSPSAAAAVMLARNANGRLEWNDGGGKALGEYLSDQATTPEQDFRRRWYEAHLDRFRGDEEKWLAAVDKYQWRHEAVSVVLSLLEDLRRNRDLEAFHEDMKAWSSTPGSGFNGFSGQMMLNQLVKRAEDPQELAQLLADVLTPPATTGQAAENIRRLVDYVESIRVGAHPASGHIPFMVSYFWGHADHERWPIMWATATTYIEYSTGESLPSDMAERYLKFRDAVLELTSDFDQFEKTAGWRNETRPVFLDDVLCDRAALNLELDDSGPKHFTNARSLVSVATYLGNELVDDVAAALGRGLKVGKPPLEWDKGYPRADLWVDWWSEDAPGLGMRVWVNERGAAIALRPALRRKGWRDEITPIIDAADYPGCRVLGGAQSRIGDDVGFAGHKGEFVYGRWFDREELADLDLREAVTSVSAQLQPLFDELLALALGESASTPIEEDDPLEPLVAEFRVERKYPTPADEEHDADRRRFAELLAPDNIGLADPDELRPIWSTARYGHPGPIRTLNQAFANADAAEYDRLVDALRYLCWGDDSDEVRIDRVLTDPQMQIDGLGETVIVKLLAICHPERYVPVFPYSGRTGKRAMLQLLDLVAPSRETRGELQLAANGLIYERLAGFFPGDPWGMAQFLYWYLERDDEAEVESDRDLLGELADELLVDRSFLADIVGLLQDKGQVILYGPPGTGKTYLARKLAQVLVPEAARRTIVQFHPSSSYEDFVEGYRPESSGGDMTYRLTAGPLASLAERAAASPGKRHLMIIDEINRANLPKVFGELLFLLEYRNERISTLYRPDDAFELPEDLWFIGTMNTADRSIALVDAALRRRFHFIPFFPNHGPMAGLLDRWLEKNDEPGWVGEMVAQINDELERELGGPHLQLGASHFMKKDLDVESMRRIWIYNIEPFIEDQFFGDQIQIEYFRFDDAYSRFLDLSGRAEHDELDALDALDEQGPPGLDADVLE